MQMERQISGERILMQYMYEWMCAVRKRAMDDVARSREERSDRVLRAGAASCDRSGNRHGSELLVANK